MCACVWVWVCVCVCVRASQWEVPPDYINVILGIKDPLTKDLVYILMAKGLHCITIKVCCLNAYSIRPHVPARCPIYNVVPAML